MQKITPCLWFDTQAEEAAKYYVSIFKNSKIRDITHYTDAGPMAKGTVLTVTFELDGQEYMALNGGPMFKFSEAVSFIINCTSQDEVDRYWNTLIADGGNESMCGWLKDKYGFSWQVIPPGFVEMMTDPDAAKVERMFKAMMKMRKLDLAVLQDAARG